MSMPKSRKENGAQVPTKKAATSARTTVA